MAYEIFLTNPAIDELKSIRVFDRRRIVGEIKTQLPHEPTVETRHRKSLGSATPGFEHVAPVWEFRVGDFRVFYDVNEPERRVYVRAVRHKAPNQTTEEVIS